MNAYQLAGISRRKAIAMAGTLLVASACDPGKLFGPVARRPVYPGSSTFTGWASPRPEYGLVPGVQCPLKWPWLAMRTTDRVPAIGQYDEADPAVTAWRLEQMERGGLEWTTYQHEWSPHLGKLLLNHCAENHPDDARISFALSWWDGLASATDELNLRYWDSTYLLPDPLPVWTPELIRESLRAYGRAVYPFTRKASYLHVDGRPVLFRGSAHSIQFYADRFGIRGREVLDLISEAFPTRPYFVATSAEFKAYASFKSWGFDAFTEYLLYSDSWPNVVKTYRDYWASSVAFAKAQDLDFWVPATCGYDNRAYFAPQGDQVFMPTPAEFTAHVAEAHTFAEKHYDVTRGRLLTYAWSEFYEGGVLEPMQPNVLHDGDEMLRAHAAAVNTNREKL